MKQEKAVPTGQQSARDRHTALKDYIRRRQHYDRATGLMKPMRRMLRELEPFYLPKSLCTPVAWTRH